jgi:putative ABC transport system ATP-binding protein
VSLARALVRRPEVLFADEPTGSLDGAAGRDVVRLLFELVRERGMALVIVTHDPEVAARADETYRVADGRLAPSDTTAAASS